ncbi:Hypothetical protein CAP_5904 [Chondromyces apiculatus DSM 436]|uniref:Uncharacterized protein n=1 Tax=Chondromyces apiculatus DSM 436 TaxID=1192034 RepID=A0A017TFZ3_9BACT|nr:Hypothetical protein CAP_5904 [Chondromyces apiculatus DSM 436]
MNEGTRPEEGPRAYAWALSFGHGARVQERRVLVQRVEGGPRR